MPCRHDQLDHDWYGRLCLDGLARHLPRRAPSLSSSSSFCWLDPLTLCPSTPLLSFDRLRPPCPSSLCPIPLPHSTTTRAPPKFSKCLNYLDLQRTSEASFVFFLFIWTYMRHYLNCRILWSVWTQFDLVPAQWRNWSVDHNGWWLFYGFGSGEIPKWMKCVPFRFLFLSLSLPAVCLPGLGDSEQVARTNKNH